MDPGAGRRRPGSREDVKVCDGQSGWPRALKRSHSSIVSGVWALEREHQVVLAGAGDGRGRLYIPRIYGRFSQNLPPHPRGSIMSCRIKMAEVLLAPSSEMGRVLVTAASFVGSTNGEHLTRPPASVLNLQAAACSLWREGIMDTWESHDQL